MYSFTPITYIDTSIIPAPNPPPLPPKKHTSTLNINQDLSTEKQGQRRRHQGSDKTKQNRTYTRTQDILYIGTNKHLPLLGHFPSGLELSSCFSTLDNAAVLLGVHVGWWIFRDLRPPRQMKERSADQQQRNITGGSDGTAHEQTRRADKGGIGVGGSERGEGRGVQKMPFKIRLDVPLIFLIFP